MQVDASVPLFGYIGRLEEQKGVDILIAALPKALQSSNIQVAILGTGESCFALGDTESLLFFGNICFVVEVYSYVWVSGVCNVGRSLLEVLITMCICALGKHAAYTAAKL